MKLLEPSMLYKFFAMLALVLSPVKPVMIAVSVLILADLITGVWASMKEGQQITSAGLKKSVVKTLVYQSAIIVGFILESYLLVGIPIVKTVAGLIGLTEGKSFFENIHRISGIDFWTEAMKKLNSGIKVLPEDKK